MNRLCFERTNKFLNAYVEHYTGRRVVEASTRESGFRKQLHSAQDVSAAMNLGKILALRCLQAGILEVHTELFKQKDDSQRVCNITNLNKKNSK